MQNKGLLIGVGIFIAVLLAGGYFVLSRSQVKPSPRPTTAATTTESGQTSSTSKVKEITVEAKEFSFSPSTITVTKGERISLMFKNVGTMPHNFTIGDLNVSTKTVSSGQSDTVEFMADKSGTFTFYCNIGSHRSFGMEGELQVQ